MEPDCTGELNPLRSSQPMATGKGHITAEAETLSAFFFMCFRVVKCSACIAICCPIVGKTGFKINLNPFIFDLVNMVICFVG